MERRLRFYALLLAGTIVLLPHTQAHAKPAVDLNVKTRAIEASINNIASAASYGKYQILIYTNFAERYEQTLEIRRNGKIVLLKDGRKFEIVGLDSVGYQPDKFSLGRDLTGDDRPNAVVMEWSGGAHCCYDFYIYNLGEELELVDVIYAEHAATAHFTDVNADGKLEFVAYDFAFAYWHASFVDSPAPQVILSYDGARYVPDMELMRQAELTDEEYRTVLEKQKAKISMACDDQEGLAKFNVWSKGEACITSQLWEHMLTLIYTGHAPEAWAFLDRQWPADDESKEEFRKEFLERLAMSNYAAYLPVDFEGLATVEFNPEQLQIQRMMDAKKERYQYLFGQE